MEIISSAKANSFIQTCFYCEVTKGKTTEAFPPQRNRSPTTLRIARGVLLA